MATQRLYLAVPYQDKDDAKKLGARWDPEKRMWYGYDNSPNIGQLLQKWKRNETPVELHGEDRTFGGNVLFVDLVPQTCWFKNVRTSVCATDWDRLREHVYERCGYVCECCGSSQSLEAHERWHYDNQTYIQKLMRLVALCKPCHQTTHIGLAQIRGRYDESKEHLKKVCNMSESQAADHISSAWDLWRQRNGHKWVLDLTLLTNNGIQINAQTASHSENTSTTRAIRSRKATEPHRRICLRLLRKNENKNGSM